MFKSSYFKLSFSCIQDANVLVFSVKSFSKCLCGSIVYAVHKRLLVMRIDTFMVCAHREFPSANNLFTASPEILTVAPAVVGQWLQPGILNFNMSATCKRKMQTRVFLPAINLDQTTI